MSCMIAPLPGGTPEIFPIPIKKFEELRENGKAAAALYGISQEKIPLLEHLGACRKADGTPFYLWIAAPDLEIGEKDSWLGVFFAPFGVGNVQGKLNVMPGDLGSEFAITTLSVDAELQIEGNTAAAASWTVKGSQLTVPNKAAIVDKVEIHDAGPHNAADIERCIRLHAPLRALGDPRAIVSMQAGVSVAALIEAIC